jgi:Capsule assembly protein Wzi
METARTRFVRLRLAASAVFFLCCLNAEARGVSPYLPLGLSPGIERQIERGLILADVPVMTRPIAAATVYDALPTICDRDAVLCDEIEHYLAGFMKTLGLAHASVALAGTSSRASPLPNRHGMPSDSAYEISGTAYWQPAGFLLVSGGIVAYGDEVVPTNSLVSIGTDMFQLDLGWRDHWLSPMTDSAMLIGTEAQTMPSVTLSNYKPLTRFKLRYEAFIGELSASDRIAVPGGFTSGQPKLAGLHLSIEPVTGWSIGVNRIMQYGGGDRPDSLGDLLDAFFRPNQFDNTGTLAEFGNQAASITSRLLLPGTRPIAVYFEYAGEDTSKNSNVRLGNAALSAGIFVPAIGDQLDLTLEVGEWQNGWYLHHIYQDGLMNEGNVIGHWGADLREPSDAVGAQSLMTRIGWRPRFGGIVEATYRTLANESYSAPDYERAHSLDVRYSRRWGEFYVGSELFVGRDVFGESYSRLSGFIRF